MGLAMWGNGQSAIGPLPSASSRVVLFYSVWPCWPKSATRNSLYPCGVAEMQQR